MTGQFKFTEAMRVQIGIRQPGGAGGRLPAPTGSNVPLGAPVHTLGRPDDTLSEPMGIGPSPRFGLKHVLDRRTAAFYDEGVP
jgi:hypothetical protein